MRLLTITWSSNDWDNHMSFAVVEINADEAKDILAKRELFQMVKSRSSDIVSMKFWNTTTVWYSGLDDIKHLLPCSVEDAEEKVANDNFLLISDEGELPPGERTCVDTLILGDDYFWGRAVPKHASYYCETSGIKYEVLLNAD